MSKKILENRKAWLIYNNRYVY